MLTCLVWSGLVWSGLQLATREYILPTTTTKVDAQSMNSQVPNLHFVLTSPHASRIVQPFCAKGGSCNPSCLCPADTPNCDSGTCKVGDSLTNPLCCMLA